MNLRPVLLLPVLALGIVSCGDDAARGPDPKTAYVERATAICDDANKQFGGLTAPTTPAGFAPYAESTVAIVEKAQVDLAALTPPEQDRAALQSRVLNPFAAVVTEAKAFVGKVRAAGTDQAQLLPLLSQIPRTDGIDKEYLRTYGLGACADAITLQPS
ncbi:MAG: hypothetical protein JWN88_3155 [Frankiales bacterium]|nr:hypothetical protein [Frankiales bacterium]